MSQQQQPSNSNNNINTNLYLSSLLQGMCACVCKTQFFCIDINANTDLALDDTHQDHNATSTNSNTSRKRSYSTDQALDGGEEEGDVSEKKERKGRKAPHELLTDAEKKANHIASEKKRRQNIRLGFDQLIEIVPSLTQGNRSEAFILQKCTLVVFMKMDNGVRNINPLFFQWQLSIIFDI